MITAFLPDVSIRRVDIFYFNLSIIAYDFWFNWYCDV